MDDGAYDLLFIDDTESTRVGYEEDEVLDTDLEEDGGTDRGDWWACADRHSNCDRQHNIQEQSAPKAPGKEAGGREAAMQLLLT